MTVAYQPVPMVTAHGAQRSQWRVEQALPYPGTLRLSGDVAELEADIAYREADAYALDLALEVKRAYHDLYRVQRVQDLIDAFQTRLRDFEAAASTRYEVGSGTQQAILQVQLERTAYEQQRFELERQARSALESLEGLLDRPMPARPADIAIARPALPVLHRDSLLARAEATRPEVRAVELAALRSEKQVELARRSTLPALGLMASYFDIAPDASTPRAGGRDAFEIGVSATVPLQRRRWRAYREEALLRQAQAESRVEALHLAIETHLDDTLNELAQEDRQLALLRDALIPQAETTRMAALSAYSTGRVSFLELLEAERMAFDLRVRYEEAFARYLNAYAALERVLGIDADAVSTASNTP
jgi:outer membrane protein TolC